LPNRLLTQAESLPPLPFYRPPRPGIAKYGKEHQTCVHNHRGDLSLKWVVSEGDNDKQRRQNHHGDDDERSQFLEKYKAGGARMLGIGVCDRGTFD